MEKYLKNKKAFKPTVLTLVSKIPNLTDYTLKMVLKFPIQGMKLSFLIVKA